MGVMKLPICIIRGHKLTNPSIVNTINSNNWLKKCDRCGQYILHGDIGSVRLSEKEAFEFKQQFEEAFPYSKRKE